MAIYQPPQKSGLGNTLEGVGAGLTAAGGITTAATGATGVGAIIGASVAGIGTLTSMAGGMINKKNEAELEMYNQRYGTIVEGEHNQAQSQQNNENAYIYNQQGVSSSVKAINQMISPTTSKGIVTNRLI